MDEQDQWLSLYIILVLTAFISGLALLGARSRYRRDNAYEPWHARLATAEGKPRHKRGWVSGVLLSVVALAAIAAVAIFFWFGNIDPQVSAMLRDIRAAQQQTTSAIEAINDTLAAERLDLKMLSDRLAQTRGTKATNDGQAAEYQFIAREARLSALQMAMARILGDNAELAERLKVIQAQMPQQPQHRRRRR